MKKKKKVSKPRNLIQLDKDIWPLERDVLFRPDRYKYVRKLIKPTGCVFCQAAKAAEDLQTLCVKKTKHSMVLLNKFPYNSGHLLILPRRHVGSLLDLHEDEYVDLHALLRAAVATVQKSYKPSGMNLGMNQGAVAGAGIPDHIHYHLIPRWAGDLNFFPLVAGTKVVIESLEQTYERLTKQFQN